MHSQQLTQSDLEILAKANTNSFQVFENLSSNPEDYLMVDCIGKGNFGDVFKAIYLPTVNLSVFPEQFLKKMMAYEYDTNILTFLEYLRDDYFVAIKIIDLEETDDEIDILCQEIQFLTTLQSERKECQNIVKYYKTFINGEKMWIIMEFCGGGSAYDLIKHLPMQLTEKIKMDHLAEAQISHIVSEVINGLIILHEKGNVHRDIKLANILLTKDGKIKLSDFGVSGKLNNTLKKRETFVGTPYWMAPEVILNGYKNIKTGVKQNGYDEKADIWSLGITIIELVNKKPPLIEHDPMQIVSKIPDLDPPSLKNNASWKCSKPLISFVGDCLKKNPEERSNGNELLKTKFIKKYENSDNSLVFAIEHVRALKLKKTFLKLNKGCNGVLLWSKKPRYYNFGNKNESEMLSRKTNKKPPENKLAWSFTITHKTPKLTKRLNNYSAISEELIRNSAENYTPTSMNSIFTAENKEKEIKEMQNKEVREVQTEDFEEINVTEDTKNTILDKIHVYNDIILPVFSDLIKRSVYPETQNAVVNLLKEFYETEKSQPGFTNVFIEEIAFKLNELNLTI